MQLERGILRRLGLRGDNALYFSFIGSRVNNCVILLSPTHQNDRSQTLHLVNKKFHKSGDKPLYWEPTRVLAFDSKNFAAFLGCNCLNPINLVTATCTEGFDRFMINAPFPAPP